MCVWRQVHDAEDWSYALFISFRPLGYVSGASVAIKTTYIYQSPYWENKRCSAS